MFPEIEVSWKKQSKFFKKKNLIDLESGSAYFHAGMQC